jgi:selenocysteine lyase/cysteine desulfurase
MMDRRTILQGLALAAQGSAAGAKDDDAYWTRVREEQFLLAPWRAYLNNGSLGVAPRPVVKAVTEYIERSATLTEDEYPRWGYEPLDKHREALAEFAGCKKNELAIMHSATEAMSTIAAGLDLKPGDEVLITDQEHPSGKGCWYMRQARQEIKVREIKIPMPPPKPEALVDLVVSAIGPNTRVLSFSGILTTTGLVMPVREICEAAKRRA